MGFNRQEYWSGLPGDLPDPGIKPMFPVLVGGFFTTEPLGKPHTPMKVFFEKETKLESLG